ncbi:SDR family oxidoreductase [Spirillospora sp. CA-294931]|uniref:type I polyketide synthase n=1 Tax=Spirillospora sp. CA-294931 TaxID=3240042 RepID=UPI003D919AF3
MTGRPGPRPVAVVALGAILPGATGVDACWRMILAGADQIREVPGDRWLVGDYYDPDPRAPDRTYAKRGGFLPRVDFDPLRYGIPPSTMQSTDSAQLLALLVADQVLDDAGALDRDRTGVIIGSTGYLPLAAHMAARTARPHWLAGLRAAGVPEPRAEEICRSIAGTFVPWQEATFPGLLPNVTAGRIANRFDLHGTNHTTDAACASSLAALSTAIDELSVGRADLILTGGVDTVCDELMHLCFSKTPALSRTGDCRPFSDDADGTILGEGVVMFALKRLDDAERDGDQIYSVITGLGTSSDGRSNAIYAPLPEGQQRALRRAYEFAGYGPETVGLVEAHGTGTRAGDKAEFSALRSVFAAEETPGRWCALGSIKSQIGHAKGAAGAAGLLKAVLALHHGVLPATIKVDRPNAELAVETSPLYLNTETRPWFHGASHPRRAAVSSFGFGGSNYHVTLEEYAGEWGRRPSRIRASPAELVLLSAGSQDGLRDRMREAAGATDLVALARAAQEGFDPSAAHRLAVVADDLEALRERLGSLDGPGVHYVTGEPDRGKVAFLFPGQGAQYPGMGAPVAVELPAARRVWDELGTLEFDGEPLHRVVFPPPAFTSEERAVQRDRVTATEWAQPALAAHSLSLYAVLAELGLTPDCVAGHSFGELVALHVAGAYDAGTLMRIARRRGELMRDAAARPGGMLAVALSRAETEAELAASGVPEVWIANSNAPEQTVLSGSLEALESMAARFARRRVPATRLRAAAAFHSPLVSAACAPFTEFLGTVEVGAPALDVYGNADAGRYPAGPDAIRARIGGHLAAPVLFAEQIEAMYAAGVRTFVEVGASGPLTGLVRRVLADRPHLAVSLDRAGQNGMHALYQGLGRLAVHGFGLDWAAHWRPYGPERPAAPPPRLSVGIDGGNHDRPYPVTTATPSPAPARIIPPDPVPELGEAVPDLEATEGEPMNARDEILRRASDAHADYQRLMTDAHLAFLHFSQQALGDETELAPLVPAPRPPATAALAPAVVAAPPAVRAPAPQAPPEPPAPPVQDGPDLAAALMEVVADRTGYPLEMLDPDMELEADLGIDSIKRVEIFSGLKGKLGELDVPASELGSLRTPQQIIDRLRTAVVPGKSLAARSDRAAGTPVTGRVVRQELVAVPAPSTGLAMCGLMDTRVLVVDEGAGLAGRLAECLRAQGVSATPIAFCEEVPDDAEGVVLLGGMARITEPADGFRQQRTAFRLARRLAPELGTTGGLFVTVQDTGGDFGLAGAGERAWVGGLAALARTAAKEWPRAAVKAVDCARADRTPGELAEAIAAELLRGGPLLDVGLPADGTRSTPRPRSVPAPAPTGESGIGPDSVVVVTGGGRGVTAAALIELARRRRPRLVLLGRTELTDEPDGLPGDADEQTLTRELARRADEPPPPAKLAARVRQITAVREIRATLAALAAAGSPARYLSVDATDAGALSMALDEVRAEWGPITAVVHAAGRLADRSLADKTDAQFGAVFDTKAVGLSALLGATSKDPLTTLCVFSSVAGTFGNRGQGDYAMANEVLAQVASAEAARRPGCQVGSIAWGPWDGGMVTPALAAHFTRAGVPLLPRAEGARAFVAEVTSGRSARAVISAADGTSRPAEALGRPDEPIRAQVTVTARSHPQLADHVIAGTPVLPMTQALEWLTGAARAWHPDADRVALRDVRVLRGAPLPDLAGEGHTFTLSGARGGLVAELRGEGEHPHYRALVEPDPGPLDPPRPPENLALSPRDEIYDGDTLFHGPLFRSLDRIEGVSMSGARGSVTGLGALGWRAGDWQTDPAAIDGALQLAVVWAEGLLGGATLPMALGEFRVHRTGPAGGPLGCTVSAEPVRGDHVRCQVALTTGDGEPFADLRDLELVLRPS